MADAQRRVVYVRVVIEPEPGVAEFAVDESCACPVARYVDEPQSRQVLRDADVIDELRMLLTDETRHWDNLWRVTQVTGPRAEEAG